MSASTPGPIRARDALRFWLPLLASWLLMTAEGPLLSAAVNRMPDEVVMLAALGIVFSLAVTLESPIINLLATSTALAKDRHAYLLLRRFTLHAMALVTIAGIVLAYTPLFDLVIRRVFGVPDAVADWVQPGLQILAFWPPAIAWRRFLQGVLIRYGLTNTLARGTALRLVMTVVTAWGMAASGEFSGVHLAAWALMAGTVTEAFYASWVVRPVLRGPLAPAEGEAQPANTPPLTYRRLLAFHLPLASTSVLTLLIQPLVTTALARLPDPTRSLAAWPLLFQFMLFLRSPALALPEAVIALIAKPGAARALRRFSLGLVAVSLGIGVLVAVPAVGRIYLVGLQDAQPDIAEMVRQGLLLLIPLPALAVLISWLRGLLIHVGNTQTVNLAMGLRVSVTAGVLGLGLLMQLPGILCASVAVVMANLCETWLLARKVHRDPKSRHLMSGKDAAAA